MKNFKRVINDISLTLTDIFLFDLVLDGIIVFLVCYFILAIINFHPLLAAGPSILFMIFAGIKKFRQNKLDLVERKYPHLKEKLKTSADYMNVDNDVIKQLQDEVVEDIKDVRSSSFLDVDNTIFKTLITILLSFLIIYISAINLVIVDTDSFITERAEALKKAIDKDSDAGADGSSALGGIASGDGVMANGMAGNALSLANITNYDIFGKKAVAKLGEEEIEMELKTNNFELNLRDESELQDKSFEETFPSGIEAVGSELYEETIAVEERELVKKYFDKLGQE